MSRKRYDVGKPQQSALGPQASDAAIAEAVNFRLFRSNGGDQNDRHYTLLHSVAQYGLVTCAEALLLDGRTNVNCLTRDLRNPLYVAVEYGQATMVSFLIKKGADVNSSHGCNGTPLQCAIRAGNTEIVEILLQAKATVNWPGESPENAFECVVRAHGSTSQVANELIDLLKEKYPDVFLDWWTGR